MKIIAFTGYKTSGKDAAAQQMRLSLLPATSRQINFADALKAEVAAACRTNIDDINKRKTQYRKLLQVWGTDYRRAMHGDNYWILEWMKAVNRLQTVPDYLFCTDVRFLNEAAVIRKLNGILIRITRPGIIADSHASETEQDSISVDFTVHNDGTVEDLKAKLKNLKLQ